MLSSLVIASLVALGNAAAIVTSSSKNNANQIAWCSMVKGLARLDSQVNPFCRALLHIPTSTVVTAITTRTITLPTSTLTITITATPTPSGDSGDVAQPGPEVERGQSGGGNKREAMLAAQKPDVFRLYADRVATAACQCLSLPAATVTRRVTASTTVAPIATVTISAVDQTPAGGDDAGAPAPEG